MKDHEAGRYALATEFPGWLIEAHVGEAGSDWGAARPLVPGHGGVVGLNSDNPTLLRELLAEAEQCDARLALRALAAELEGWDVDGVIVRGYDTNVIVEGPGERERLITCQGGMFRWAMGGHQIGPIGDVAGAVEHVVSVLRESPS